MAADFNENGYVDGDDLADWKADFGSPDATHMQGDADGDSDSDGADFLIWQRQLGSGVLGLASNVAVPEPPTALLLTTCVGACLWRRRQAA